jgi:hypothetical protein
MAGLKKRSPRLKVTTDANNVTKTAPEHPDLGIGQLALMKVIGTSDVEFYDGLIGQLVNASKEKLASEKGANFMLSVVKGIEQRGQVEAMLAAPSIWPRGLSLAAWRTS